MFFSYLFQKLCQRKSEKSGLQVVNFREKQRKKIVSSINFTQLKIQEYFHTDELPSQQKKLLVQLRTQTIPVLANRKFNQKSIVCILCWIADDTVAHQFVCQQLVEGTQAVVTDTSSVDDIFSDIIGKQTIITQIFDSLYKSRKQLLRHVKII